MSETGKKMGRPRTAPDGELRTMKSMKASSEEWELIKKVARIIKHEPVLREKLLAIVEESEKK